MPQEEESAAVSPPASNSAPAAVGESDRAAELLPSPSAEQGHCIPVDTSEQHWRQELTQRLEAYRARRRRSGHASKQPPLPFLEEPDYPPPPDTPRVAARPSPRLRPRPPERVEIRVDQPGLNFSAEDSFRQYSDSSLVPVADFSERRFAGLLDATFIFLSYVGFLSIFRSLGGQLSFEKVDWIVYAATFFLFYMQYFALFTTFNGDTPGMRLRGLSVVSLDGSLPCMRQLVWRSFGYVLSGGTFLMGFLWSLWDEDHLTWQDRISQTYLTSAIPLDSVESINGVQSRHTYAQK